MTPALIEKNHHNFGSARTTPSLSLQNYIAQILHLVPREIRSFRNKNVETTHIYATIYVFLHKFT